MWFIQGVFIMIGGVVFVVVFMTGLIAINEEYKNKL